MVGLPMPRRRPPCGHPLRGVATARACLHACTPCRPRVRRRAQPRRQRRRRQTRWI